MKKQYILLLFLAVIMLSACEKDYQSPNTVSDISWYTSKQNKGNYNLNQGDFMGFMDLSQGALSHEWVIEQGDFFLKKGFTQKDSLALFADNEKGLVSTDAAVSILFDAPGLRYVRLHNTFKDSVYFNGTIPYGSKRQGDIWVIDTSFVVDVYAKMQPAYKVFQLIEDDNGNLIQEKEILSILETDQPSLSDSASWPTISVEVGGRLKFVDLTKIDRPTGRSWSIENSEIPTTSGDSAAVFYFNKLNFKTGLLGKFTSNRFGNTIPGNSATKIIPLKVQVIPSSKPFYFTGSLIEHEDKSITFNVSGEAALFSAQESAFIVHVTNENGFDKIIPVALAKVKTDNATAIELTLSESIYGSDVITVEYDATKGVINSKDERVLTSFGPSIVQMYTGAANILIGSTYFGFEASNTNLTSALCPGYWRPNGDGSWQRSLEQSASGSASMRYSAIINNQILWGMQITRDQSIPIGTYLISHRIYVSEGSTIKSFTTDFANKSDNYISYGAITWNIATIPRGKWVTIQKKVTFSVAPQSGGGNCRLSYYVNTVDNAGVTGNQTFYLDDVSMVPLEIRP